MSNEYNEIFNFIILLLSDTINDPSLFLLYDLILFNDNHTFSLLLIEDVGKKIIFLDSSIIIGHFDLIPVKYFVPSHLPLYELP